jgi:hypothetical protein
MRWAGCVVRVGLLHCGRWKVVGETDSRTRDLRQRQPIGTGPHARIRTYDRMDRCSV